jgi:hypothetical protein
LKHDVRDRLKQTPSYAAPGRLVERYRTRYRFRFSLKAIATDRRVLLLLAVRNGSDPALLVYGQTAGCGSYFDA